MRSRLPIAVVLLVLGTDASTLSVSAPQTGRTHDQRHPQPTRADGDRDRDGVIDALDNCLVHPNADQRDTDRDGIGNRCDADFDNDGVVDLADLRLLWTGASPQDADFDGDGDVDRHDWAIFVSLFGRRPGPRLDSDGDGQAEIDDPCPGTRSNDRMLLPGCSALDIVGQPEFVLSPLLESLEQIGDLLADQRDLATAHTALDLAKHDFNEAIRATRAGGLCAGSDAVNQGVRQLELTATELAAATRRLEAAVTPPERVEPFDVSEPELAAAGLGVPRQWTTIAQSRAQSIHDALRGMCMAARPLTETAVIKQVIDDRHRIEMMDGRVFDLADPLHLSGPVFDGRRVRMTGSSFGDRTGVVTELGPAGSEPIAPPHPSANCVELRVAPVQLFPPFTDGPFLLHRPEGYRKDGQYWLEQGMGLAAVQTCPPSPNPGVKFTRFSLELLIAYTDRVKGIPVGPVMLAADLGVADGPVVLPFAIDPAVGATLFVTARAQTCFANAICSDPTVLEVRTYELKVMDRGAACTATYNRTLFDVNDQIPSDFRGALVDDVLVNLPSDTPAVFEADGYASPLFLFSTFPTVVTINGGGSFAVHNQDFFPIHKADPTKFGFATVVAHLTTGVDHAAGLKWPRTRGTRNGRPFQYSCRLPEVVRDVVNFCVAPVNAFYRMPFPPDDVSWTQGQGNLGPPGSTHHDAYAYDMLAAENTPIHAARAGRVIFVDESNSLRFGDPGCEDWVKACPANRFTVWHQDGSIAEYNHSPKDGIIVEVGDLVRRGEEVAKVGQTGRASEPHVHIGTATEPRPKSKNILHLYEAANPTVIGPIPTLKCYEPKQGDLLRSNNMPWP